MAATEKSIELLLELAGSARRRTRPETIARALQAAIQLLDADAASVLLPSTRRRAERLILYAGSDTPASLPLAHGQSEAIRCLGEERQALLVPDLADHEAFSSADACPGVEAGPVLFVPVDGRDRTPGFLAIYRKRGRARYTANETELILLLAAWLGAALEALRHPTGAEHATPGDEPTEALHARVRTTLKRELRRAGRYGQELSVLWIEIDGMPAFRDTHGSERASQLVRAIAAVLAAQVRSFDHLARGGEDRFLAVLPQTGLASAREVAERMRAAIATHAPAPAESAPVTATVGIAAFPADGVEVDALLALAERALDQARAQGRNRVATTPRKAA